MVSSAAVFVLVRECVSRTRFSLAKVSQHLPAEHDWDRTVAFEAVPIAKITRVCKINNAPQFFVIVLHQGSSEADQRTSTLGPQGIELLVGISFVVLPRDNQLVTLTAQKDNHDSRKESLPCIGGTRPQQ